MLRAEADYLHVLDGRIRIRIREIRRQPAAARALEARLSEMPGITAVQANPVTGSALILFDPAIVRSEGMLDALRDAGYLKPQPESVRTVRVRTAKSRSRRPETLARLKRIRNDLAQDLAKEACKVLFKIGFRILIRAVA